MIWFRWLGFAVFLKNTPDHWFDNFRDSVVSWCHGAGYTRPLVTSLVSAVGLLTSIYGDRPLWPPGCIHGGGGGEMGWWFLGSGNSSQIPLKYSDVGIEMIICPISSTMLTEPLCHALVWSYTRWVNSWPVLSPSWRSVNHWKGRVNSPSQKVHVKNCEVVILSGKIWGCPITLA